MEKFFATDAGSPLANAFSGKKVVHPFLASAPVPPSDWDSVWRGVTELERTGKSVAYVHIPFCHNHCLFCGFYKNPWRKEDGRHYVDILAEEFRRDQDRPYQKSGPIHAVYFGGGTPSALSACDLARLIEVARETLPLAPDCEITIEGRIHGSDIDKMKACFDVGANRVSIGVQCFDEKLRKRMGRKASRKETIRFLEQLVRVDAGAIVIDLIYGFPDQDMASWEDDLRTVQGIGLDGVDLYSLNLIASSPLHRAIESGKYNPTVPGEELGRYYARGAELMENGRWESISTTHWRRTTRERNLYNLLVKQGANCLAFGSGAGGFLGGFSFRIEGDLESYSQRANRGEKPLAFMMRQPAQAAFYNSIKGQMEVGRLDTRWLSSRMRDAYGLDCTGIVMPLIKQWRRAGLLGLKDGWLDLTLAGRFWQVTMTQHLLEWINANMETPEPMRVLA